jgi:hypothetical protein
MEPTKYYKRIWTYVDGKWVLKIIEDNDGR